MCQMHSLAFVNEHFTKQLSLVLSPGPYNECQVRMTNIDTSQHHLIPTWGKSSF